MALKVPTDLSTSSLCSYLTNSLVLPARLFLKPRVACKPGFPPRATTEAAPFPATLRPHRAAQARREAEGAPHALSQHLTWCSSSSINSRHPSTNLSAALATSVSSALHSSEQTCRLCPVSNSAREQSRLILFSSKSRAYPGLHRDHCSQITSPVWLSSSELALSRHPHKQTLLPPCDHL